MAITEKDNSNKIFQKYFEIDKKLRELKNKDPRLAIEAARSLAPDLILNQENIDGLSAGILIDAGIILRDIKAINEGVAIFERLHKGSPERGDVQYCLANGLLAQADMKKCFNPNWYISTMDLRRRARLLLRSSIMSKTSIASVVTEAYTNLGNTLRDSFRFAEAYEAYLEALNSDSKNGVALTGAVRILLHFIQNNIGCARVLYSVASRYLKRANENKQRIRELVGEHGFKHILKLLEQNIPIGEYPDLSKADKYQRFIAENRLSLAPTIEGLDLSLKRWDSLKIKSVIVSKKSLKPPSIFAMFNIIKSDFLAARYLAYLALKDTLPESGSYVDTLDYAEYGIQQSILTLAQRSCFDLLDKVAVSTSEYFEMPSRFDRINFSNRWFENHKEGEPWRWQSKVLNEINFGNTPLIAISEVAQDINCGGYLYEKKSLRNTSTHRFTILHTLSSSGEYRNDYVDHYNFGIFKDQLIETLKLVRAVLFYFVEMVNLCERRKGETSKHIIPIILPDHDWIRGRS